MAFSDVMYLVIFAFLFVIVILTSDYLYNAVMGTEYLENNIPAEINESVEDSWDTNVSFANNSFAGIWFILGIVSIGLTIFLASHPIVLIGWILFNIITLFVFDVLTDFLTQFLLSDLNTGVMNVAIAFIENDLAKAVIVLNVLIGAVLFGKQVLTQ